MSCMSMGAQRFDTYFYRYCSEIDKKLQLFENWSVAEILDKNFFGSR